MERLGREENAKINEFFGALEEMIAGKFILADTKIQKILKCIATSSVLYDIFGKCMVGFHFKEEFAKSTNTTFTLPEGTQKQIAYVFCFMLEIDNKQLSLQNFITEHFYHKDGYHESYHNFSLTMLVPFRDGVKALIDEHLASMAQETKSAPQPKPQPKVQEVRVDPVYDQLKNQLTTLLISVKQSRKIKNVQSIEMVIDAMKEALTLQNWKLINGLLISLDCLLEKEKSVASAYDDLKDIVYNHFYK